MPELPEVECLKLALEPMLSGALVRKIWFFRDDLRFEIPKQKIRKVLLKTTIKSVKRRSKYLLISTEKGTVLLHLGMSGSLLRRGKAERELNHTHIVFEVFNGCETSYLHYVDPRRFGFIEALGPYESPLTSQRLRHLGPEPLELVGDTLAEVLYESSRGIKQSIKAFIMDAKRVVGVGNIYANEALFSSKIHPLRPASKVKKSEFLKLGKAIQTTLIAAIKQGGTTLRDYQSTEGKPGYFSVSLKVYGKEGEPCPKCGTPLGKVVIAGRASFFCQQCQPKAGKKYPVS